MTGKIKLNAASGGGSVSLQAPSSSGNDRVYTVPDIGSDGTLATTATAGKILQLKSVTKTDTASVTDNATPQDISGLSITLTPASASSKFYITGKVQMSLEYATTGGIHINVNGTEVGKADTASNRPVAHSGVGYTQVGTPSMGHIYSSYAMAFDFLVNASNSNAHTIKIQMTQSATGYNRTLYINRSQTDPDGVAGPRYTSTLTVMEVAA